MINKIKYALLPLAAGLLLAGCQGFKEWARKVEQMPAGTGIQGKAAVDAVLTILKKYKATPKVTKQAETDGKQMRAAMPVEEKKALLEKAEPEEEVYIAVPVAPSEETHAKAKASVMLFGIRSQKIVGKQVYDLKNAPKVEEAKAASKEYNLDGFQVTFARRPKEGILIP